jgi:hypothetical protein
MVPLIDTVIGFSAIMLMLSLLVKSLTSLIKNHVDFYSRNLQHEVNRLALGVLGKSRKAAVAQVKSDQDKRFLEGINWERVGDEFLTKGHVEWLLTKLGATGGALQNLEQRLQVHAASIKYAFDARMKNVALAVGLVLCLGLNINGLTIWKTLYGDQQLRTTFATTYAQSALLSAEKTSQNANPANKPAAAKKAPGKDKKPGSSPNPALPGANTTEPAATGSPSPTDQGSETAQKEKLNEDTQTLMSELADFQKNVNFGIGRIWTENSTGKTARSPWKFFANEFFGSLMTAVLISIGAAYWHDLLRTLTSFSLKKRDEETQG